MNNEEKERLVVAIMDEYANGVSFTKCSSTRYFIEDLIDGVECVANNSMTIDDLIKALCE